MPGVRCRGFVSSRHLIPDFRHQTMAQAKKALAKNSSKKYSRASTRPSVKTYQNYIGGKWVPSESGEVFENINPADTDDVIGRFPLSTSDDVNAAVNAAQGAFDGWRRLPAPKRA